MACLETIPNEVLHKIVDVLMDEGLHGSAVALARTNKNLELRALPRIYRSVIENETFFLAHWAAEHGHVSILERAIEADADINEPWTTCTPVYEMSRRGEEPEFRRLRAADLDGKELDRAIQQRCSLMDQDRSDHGQWYLRKGKGYEEIDIGHTQRLFNYYIELNEGGSGNGTPDQSADALDTKRMFLDAFAYWATPLHIAILKGNCGIVEALLQNDKLNLNSSMHGSCSCLRAVNWMPHDCAFSALHQALCNSKGFYIPKLIKLGTSYLSLTKSMLDATADTLLVNPVLVTPQPRNLLHETLSHERYWGLGPVSGRCMEQYYDGQPREWIVNILLDNGYENRVHERDHNQKLAVEIACDKRPNSTIITNILRRGVSQYDGSINLSYRFGDNDDTGSILTWALARNDLHLADYLLTHENMKPIFDISAPSACLGYTSLHILCMKIDFSNQDASRHLRDQLLHKILPNFEVDTVSSGYTPLTFALKWLVENPGPEAPPLLLLRTLLEHGADILNENQTSQKTPLEIFLERIVYSEYYSKNPDENDRSDCDYYDPEKQSCLVQAIAEIRLYDYRTDRNDGLDFIFPELRDPVDLAWVPRARRKLRRNRLAGISYSMIRSNDLACSETSAV